MRPEFKTVSESTYNGRSGTYGLRIQIADSVEFSNKEAESLIRNAGKLIEKAVRLNRFHQTTDVQALRRMNIEELKALFPSSIWVQEIPNEYWPDSYVEYHLTEPWLLVYTTFGPVKIGRRKRVIEIDWSRSDLKVKAETLFPDLDVTKGDHYIHAWDAEKAKLIIETLFREADAQKPQVGATKEQ